MRTSSSAIAERPRDACSTSNRRLVNLSKKLYSRLHSIEVEFYSKKEKFAF